MSAKSIALLLALTSAFGCRAAPDVVSGHEVTSDPKAPDHTAGEHAGRTTGIAIDALVVELPRTLLGSMLSEAELAGSARDAAFVETISELTREGRGGEIVARPRLTVRDGGEAEISVVDKEPDTEVHEHNAEGLPTRVPGAVKSGLWFAAQPHILPDGALRLGYTVSRIRHRGPIPEGSPPEKGGAVTIQLSPGDMERAQGEPVLRAGECWVVGLTSLANSDAPRSTTIVLLTPSVITLPVETGMRVIPERAALEAAAVR